MVAETAVRVSAVPVQVATVVRAVRVSVVAIALVTEVRVVKAVKTGVRVSVTPLSAPNAKPWSVPKCRCANWPHKPMAKR
jgi:hypothetical protein